MILNQYLYNYITIDNKDWGDHLGSAELCYYSTKHLAIKMSPLVGLGSWSKTSHGSIELEVGDSMWLNIKDFKMFKTLANKFVPKLWVPIRLFVNPTHMCIFVITNDIGNHPTFHMSKLKSIHEDKKRKNHKHVYHPNIWLHWT